MWPLLAAIIAGGVFITLQSGFSFGGAITLSVIALGMAIWRAWPLCRVTLTESEISINFLLPTRKGGNYRHEEIEGYNEIALNMRGKKILVGGIIKPFDENQLMIMRSGIKSFEELNTSFIEHYPRLLTAEHAE